MIIQILKYLNYLSIKFHRVGHFIDKSDIAEEA